MTYGTTRSYVVWESEGNGIITRIRRKQIEVSPQVALAAIEFIANRALGKPAQPLTGSDINEPLPITKVEHVILQLETDSSGAKRISAADFDPRVIDDELEERLRRRTN